MTAAARYRVAYGDYGQKTIAEGDTRSLAEAELIARNEGAAEFSRSNRTIIVEVYAHGVYVAGMTWQGGTMVEPEAPAKPKAKTAKKDAGDVERDS